MSKGRLVIKEISFDQMLVRTCRKANERSCKVTLPIELLDKKVYIVIPKEGD